MNTTLKLIGYDETTGSTFGAEVVDGDVHAALGRLFDKAFRSHGPIFNPRWFCGVPAVDRAVVWVGQSRDARQHSLHVSFSDGRVWPQAE